MGASRALIGRDRELGRLEEALAQAENGEGSLVLVSGEAGIGKTRLAEELATTTEALVLRGAASESAARPYGPVAAALRSFLRARPDGLDECGPLRPHVAMLLPELGEAPPQSDRGTLFEAVRCAIATAADGGARLIVLDDLQWSDAATIDLLASLAEPLEQIPVLVVAAYRSDEVGREHPVRRLRDELRRAGRLEELGLAALDAEQAAALATAVLDGAVGDELAATIQDRTQGYPFFVEELAAALLAGGAIRDSDGTFELSPGSEVPIPNTIRDAVLMRIAGISAAARAAAEAAAVAGEHFEIDPVARLAGGEGFAEPGGPAACGRRVSRRARLPGRRRRRARSARALAAGRRSRGPARRDRGLRRVRAARRRADRGGASLARGRRDPPQRGRRPRQGRARAAARRRLQPAGRSRPRACLPPRGGRGVRCRRDGRRGGREQDRRRQLPAELGRPRGGGRARGDRGSRGRGRRPP